MIGFREKALRTNGRTNEPFSKKAEKDELTNGLDRNYNGVLIN